MPACISIIHTNALTLPQAVDAMFHYWMAIEFIFSKSSAFAMRTGPDTIDTY